MSKTDTNDSESNPFSPHLYLSFTTNCNIFDLSGKFPFKICVGVSRQAHQFTLHPDEHKLQIDLLADGSLLDISAAVKKGLLSLTEIDSGPSDEQGQGSEQVLSKELFTSKADDLVSSLPHIIRLKSGSEIPAINPQYVECMFDSSISAAFKNNMTYALRDLTKAEQSDQSGGVTWWKLVTDALLPLDPTLPSDKPAVRIKTAPLPIFRAMSDPAAPPRIEYEVEITPADLSLSDPDIITLSVKYRLLETVSYSVMAVRTTSGPGPKSNALASCDIGSFSFDIIDVDTREILSAVPIYGNALFSSHLPRQPFRKEHLRHLEPGVTYTGQSEVIRRDSQDKLTAFLEYFRIKEITTIRGRRLGVKLRPVQTFWSQKSIDELFEHKETLKPDHWYIPLTIESPAVAEFRVV